MRVLNTGKHFKLTMQIVRWCQKTPRISGRMAENFLNMQLCIINLSPSDRVNLIISSNIIFIMGKQPQATKTNLVPSKERGGERF